MLIQIDQADERIKERFGEAGVKVICLFDESRVEKRTTF